MIFLMDQDAILAALEIDLPDSIEESLRRIANDSTLVDLTFVAIVGPDVSESDLTIELGWNPLHDPIDGGRWNSDTFRIYWAALSKHADHYELVHCVGNSGHAVVVMVQRSGDSELLAMCRRFAR